MTDILMTREVPSGAFGDVDDHRGGPQDSVSILADMRWPGDTGIGQVQHAYLSRLPSTLKVIDLRVEGRLGHPLSPLRIARAMRRHRAAGSFFWSAGFMPPLWGTAKAIVIVHDLMHLQYYSKTKALYYNLVLKPLYRRCAAIVCVSEYVRDEFLAWSGVDQAKMHVIPNGIQPRFLTPQKPDKPFPHDYILYVGNHRPYKNLHRLIEAYGVSGLSAAGVHLVLSGHADDDLVALATTQNVGDFVHFVGSLPSEAIPSFYRAARAIAYVSLSEGFGLPIIEAMACGVPIVTSNVTAMPEVAGDAAILVDPYSLEDIAKGLIAACTNDDLRAEIVRKGLTRVRNFDWDISARKMWTLVEHHARLSATYGIRKLT